MHALEQDPACQPNPAPQTAPQIAPHPRPVSLPQVATAVAPATAGPRVALCEVPTGAVVIVLDTTVAEDDAAMLRAMGLVPGATVRVCRTGEPCIVAVMHTGASSCACGGSRIGLAKRLARQVFVRANATSGPAAAGGAAVQPLC